MKHAIGVIFLCILLLSGCTSNKDLFSGIRFTDIQEAAGSANLKLISQYKGQSDDWAASYTVYQVDGSTKNNSKLLLKYIGKKPAPTGEIKFDFDIGGSDTSSGSATYSNAPAGDVYLLSIAANHGDVPVPTSTLKLNVHWQSNAKSQIIELIKQN